MPVYTLIVVLALLASPIATSNAAAQTADSRWNVEASVGWDIGLSGDFLSAGIGVINEVPVVFQSAPFDDVYGNGVLWTFGVGFMVDDINEVRGQFSYQRVGADAFDLGTAGTSRLIATVDDYKVSSLEGAYRHYFAPSTERLRPYAGGLIAVAVIPEIDGVLVAPEAGLARYVTDFYDGTAAFVIGVTGGVLYELNDRLDLNGQLAFRRTSGLSAVDNLQGTGLEGTNDKSSRWTMPLTFGLRFKF